jgi:hypothetical protein
MSPTPRPGRRIREWDQFRRRVGLTPLDESVRIPAPSELVQHLGQLDFLSSARASQPAARPQRVES